MLGMINVSINSQKCIEHAYDMQVMPKYALILKIYASICEISSI